MINFLFSFSGNLVGMSIGFIVGGIILKKLDNNTILLAVGKQTLLIGVIMTVISIGIGAIL